MNLMLWNNPFENLLSDRHSYSKTEIFDDGKEISIEIEAPGMNGEEVSVGVERGTLSIKGESKGPKRYRSFSKRYSLPEAVDEGSIGASLKDGILTVTLPKKEVSSRKVVVRTE